jgi:hypothetical protein
VLKSGMDPDNDVRRLASTTTGHRTKITGQLVSLQLEVRERSASFKRWDFAYEQRLRLSGTMAGHRTKITGQLVSGQRESRERSASFKRWDLA